MKVEIVLGSHWLEIDSTEKEGECTVVVWTNDDGDDPAAPLDRSIVVGEVRFKQAPDAAIHVFVEDGAVVVPVARMEKKVEFLS